MKKTLGTSHVLVATLLSAGPFICSAAPHAETALLLKLSKSLNSEASKQVLISQSLHAAPSLLGKVALFRGVPVLETEEVSSRLQRSEISVAKNEKNDKPRVNAIYGGIQLSLQENLSLVYSPGRLSSQNLNSDSQGIYLMSNQQGKAHWFMGVESNSYAHTADSRRTENTTHFGVMLNLD